MSLVPELQEDGSGTKVISISLCLLLVSPLVPQDILVMAPELQEDGLGTKDDQHKFMSITCLSSGATRYPGHSTRIARGFVRYKGEKGTSSVHLYLSLLWYLERCHGTRIARGMGLVQLLVMSIRFISEFLNLNCKRCPSTSLYELRCV